MRPQNDLLQILSPEAFKLLAGAIEMIDGKQGQVLHRPGDVVQDVYFPCGPCLLSFAVAADEDREVEAVLIGREGASGNLTLGIRLPAYGRTSIKVGGPVAKLSARKLGDAKQSPELQQLLSRYAQYLLAHITQSAACNATHSIEQRTAKWMLQIFDHTGAESVTLTHEQLAAVLGIGRSYVSRIIQGFKEDRVLSTARGELRILDIEALRRKSCHCNDWLKTHYAEVFPPRPNP